MYRVCSLWLGQRFGVWSAAKKNLYLRLACEKSAFVVFLMKYAEVAPILQVRLNMLENTFLGISVLN